MGRPNHRDGYQATADGFNPKFTGQQRDPESLLDYYHARYYAPYQGRMTALKFKIAARSFIPFRDHSAAMNS